MAGKKKLPLSGNTAIAYAVKAADVDVISAYPITPQTTIVEKLTEFVANGELDAEVIHVESEHSALSAAVGASAAGARVFTASSSQGIALMYEIMFIASSMRLPIVMAMATRALSAPINIWNDHSDFMAASDTGWVMMMAHTNQEAHDDIILAYKIAEHPDVLLPVITAIDGYFMSHTIEPVEPIEREEALKFIPKKVTWSVLDPDNPVTMGPLGTPEWYYEFKRQQHEAMKKAREVFDEATKEFEKVFGRRYEPVEYFMMDDAEYALVAMGSVAGNVKAYIVKEARNRGIKLGLIRVKLFRPFPAKELIEVINNLKAVGVIDRALAFGSSYGGPLYGDILSAAYTGGVDTPIVNFIAGLGGRPVTFRDIKAMVDATLALDGKTRKDVPKEPYFIGVRE